MLTLKNRKWKIWIPAIVVFAMFTAYLFAAMENPITTQRGQDRVTRIENGVYISQEILLSNTDEIVLGILNDSGGNNSESAKLKFILEQGITRQEVTAHTKEFTDRIWYYYRPTFDYSQFENGVVKLTITGEYMSNQDVLAVLLSINAKQPKQLHTTVSINNEHLPETYLQIQYTYFNKALYIKFFLLVLFLYICCYVLGPTLLQGIFVQPVFLFATLMIIVTFIKNFGNGTLLLDAWCTTPYMLNYSYGFISRGLPGTILMLFNRLFLKTDFVSITEFKILFLSMLIVLIGLLLYWLMLINSGSYVIKDSEEILSGISFLYIASPFFATFFISSTGFGRLDVHLFIIFILCCLTILNEKCLSLIPLFCAVAILTHQVFLFLYAPTIMLLMFWGAFIRKNKNFYIPLIITIVLCSGLGIYVQFFSSIKNIPFEEIWASILSKTDAPMLDLCVKAEHYFDAQYYKDYFMNDIYSNNLPVRLFFSLILLFPLLYGWKEIWNGAIKNSGKRLNSIFYFTCFCSPLSIVPLLLVPASDWARWLFGIGNSAFFLLMIFLKKGDIQVKKGIETVTIKTKANIRKYIFVMLCIFYTSLGIMENYHILYELTIPLVNQLKNFITILS